MLTERIDRALAALRDCRFRVPALRDLYRPGTPERAALDAVVAAVEAADRTLTQAGSRAGAGRWRSR